jgi:hypothetical protein
MSDRNIRVGKSWPRPATPCDLVPKWEGEFCSFGDWVSFASKRLTVAEDSNGSPLSAMCVDALGRRCHNGRDFARARDENAFPVRYFFECELPAKATEPEADFDITKAGEVVALSTWKRNNESIFLRLLLVDADPNEEMIASWTDEQARLADCYAVAAHLSASDNDEIQVPPRPEFIPRLPAREPYIIPPELTA